MISILLSFIYIDKIVDTTISTNAIITRFRNVLTHLCNFFTRLSSAAIRAFAVSAAVTTSSACESSS